MSFLRFLFPKKKNSLEEMDKLNDNYIAKNPNPKDEENALIRQASKCMTSKNFDAAIKAYQELTEKYPLNRGLYESQVGAAYYFLNDFESAINYYISALKNGADESMMDDNIWEATEAIYSQRKNKNVIEDYKNLFPKGSHSKKADKLLLG